MKMGNSGVLLCVLGLIVASGVAGTAVAANGAGDAKAVGEANEVSDEQPARPASALAQADNNTTDNESLTSLGIPSLSITVDGTTVAAETILLTVRQGTGALYVKTLTTQNPDEDASITNARVAVGEQFWQQIATGEFDGAQYALSFGRFAVGDFELRLGTGVIRGVIGVAPPRPTDAGGAEQADGEALDRSSFTVTNFSAPENVTLGESYTVSATVRNPSSENGTEIVRYQFGDVTLGKQLVQLGPNESTNVTYQVSPAPLPNSPGVYSHQIEAFDSDASANIRLVAPNATSENESAANATRPPVVG